MRAKREVTVGTVWGDRSELWCDSGEREMGFHFTIVWVEEWRPFYSIISANPEHRHTLKHRERRRETMKSQRHTVSSSIWHIHTHTTLHTFWHAFIVMLPVSLSLTLNKAHTQKARARHKEKTVLSGAPPPCNPSKLNQTWTPAVRTMTSALAEQASSAVRMSQTLLMEY